MVVRYFVIMASRNRHPEGHPRSERFLQLASSPEGPCVCFVAVKHKIPHPYSRADENARSLNGVRDDVTIFVSLELPEAAT
jgi:hypothetical protein